MGEPFFLLLCAIKQQINKGSIDAITGKARYTLNEEWLLRENIEAKPQVGCFTLSSHPFDVKSARSDEVADGKLAKFKKALTVFHTLLCLSLQNINVSFQGCGMDSLSVRVMNTDTICQVKEKIIEAFYKNLPFSQWPRAEDVDLGESTFSLIIFILSPPQPSKI